MEMMMFKYAAMMILAVCTLTGCVSVSYHGNTYPATEGVKLFEDRTLIPENYVEIGKCVAYGRYESFSKEKICGKIRDKAEDVGADTVFIYAYQVIPEAVVTSAVEGVWSDSASDKAWTDGTGNTIWDRMDRDFASYGQIGKDTSSARSHSSYVRVIRAEFLKHPDKVAEPIKTQEQTPRKSKVGPEPDAAAVVAASETDAPKSATTEKAAE